MRRPYRLARPVPSTACLSASLILCAKMNHRILVGPQLSYSRNSTRNDPRNDPSGNVTLAEIGRRLHLDEA